MIKLKLSRFGRNRENYFRIVVQPDREKRDGRYLDVLGSYNPHKNPPTINLDLDKVKKWMSQGAQPTETVASLIKRVEKGNKPRKRATRDYKKIKAKEEASAPKEEKPQTEAKKEEQQTGAETPKEKQETTEQAKQEKKPEEGKRGKPEEKKVEESKDKKKTKQKAENEKKESSSKQTKKEKEEPKSKEAKKPKTSKEKAGK